MKTKKFVRLMEDAGFIVNDRIDDLIIKIANAFDERTVCAVSKTHEYVFDNHLSEFKNLPIETRKFMTSTLYEYSSTPLDARESIELSELERLILENLPKGFKTLRIDDTKRLCLVVNPIYSRKFDVFHGLFEFAESGKEYLIADLLNAK
ncbi:hypothetical protein [Jeotgalibaca porci]|uniref:hypothetical protein n=1 Tax=Jeotgalibaca porci TaxID=1868793 RepID=UPI0035A0E0BA